MLECRMCISQSELYFHRDSLLVRLKLLSGTQYFNAGVEFSAIGATYELASNIPAAIRICIFPSLPVDRQEARSPAFHVAIITRKGECREGLCGHALTAEMRDQENNAGNQEQQASAHRPEISDTGHGERDGRQGEQYPAGQYECTGLHRFA